LAAFNRLHFHLENGRDALWPVVQKLVDKRGLCRGQVALLP
jgi:hypothetical protein